MRPLTAPDFWRPHEPLRTLVTSIVVLAIVAWGALLVFVYGQPLTVASIAPLGATITIVTLTAILFEQHLWRWPIFRGWFVERPDLQGTWRTRLNSNFVGSDGSETVKIVYVVIRQTLSSLTLRMYTDKAQSASIASSLYREGGDLFSLSIAYQSVPNVEQREGPSQIHYGAVLFTHIDWTNRSVTGHYWTDRKTHGSLVLLTRKSELVSNYKDAADLFGNDASQPI